MGDLKLIDCKVAVIRIEEQEVGEGSNDSDEGGVIQSICSLLRIVGS